MSKITDNIIHGGQTQLHKLHMLHQVVTITLWIALCIGCLFFVIFVSQKLNLHEVCAVGSYHLAHFLHTLPWVIFKTVPFWFQEGFQQVSLGWVLTNQSIVKLVHKSHIVFYDSALKAMVTTIFFGIFIVLYWIYKGRKRRESRVLSGNPVVEPKKLKKILSKNKELSAIKITGIPLPKNAETEHILFAGTTGTGKSNAIFELLVQIRSLGHKAILVDSTSLMVSKFFRNGCDHILNPLDQRAKPWHLWSECKSNSDFEALAETMIPQSGNDPFWSNAARTVFVESVKKFHENGEHSIQSLLDITIRHPLKETYNFLKNTTASSMVDPSADKTALSIRSTLATHLKALENIEDTDTPFSIRNWLLQEDDSWLFLNCTPGQRAGMRSLMSGWFSIAMRSIMDLPPSQLRRIWFVIDELPSLNAINELPRAIAELRKYGGCCVLGTQDLSQLDEIYGQNITRSLSSLTGTKVIFRAADEYNAERLSRSLGKKDVIESNESISFGAHQYRDGVSLSEHRQTKPIVTPNDIMALNNLEAYLKLPGNVPVSKVSFEYHKLIDSEPAFLEKVK